MDKLRIFVDFVLPPDVLEMLKVGTADHELLFPAAPVTSVLDKGKPDPQLTRADVAFGQPDPQGIAEARHLKWIHISTSGITRYDTPEFRALVADRGIAFSNSASVYSEACATHALGFILAQARQLPRALSTRTPGGSAAWDALRDSCLPLKGQTALILGYGAIGRRLVEMLRPFEMNILAYRRNARGDEDIPVITKDQLAHALGHEADHIVNILPDNSETRQFFDHGRFSVLKPGAVFYNIGRGTTVDQEALLAALRAGRLAAAWLDVTDPEPLPDDHPLWSEPHCHITPHIAGGHAQESVTLVRHFLANFKRFNQGSPLLDRVT